MQTTRCGENIRTSQHPCAQSQAGVTNVDDRISSVQELVHRQFHPGGSRLFARCAVSRQTGRQAFHGQLPQDRQAASRLDNPVICSAATTQRGSVRITGSCAGVRKHVDRAQSHVPPQTVTARLSGQAAGVAGYNPDLNALVPLPVQDGEPQTQERSQPQEINPSPAIKRVPNCAMQIRAARHGEISVYNRHAWRAKLRNVF